MQLHARWTRCLLVSAALWAAPIGLQADTLWFKSATAAGAKPFERPNLKVLKIEGENLVFKSLSSDQQDTKPLADVFQIKVDNEAALNAAEEQYAAGDFAKATTEYQKAMDATRTPWVKFRSTLRIIDAAAKSKNFPAAVKGYAELLKLDPTMAATAKPTIPAGAPGALDAAVSEAKKAVNAAGVTADQKNQLLTLQLELARANGDNAMVAEVAKLLSGTPNPVGPAGGNTPPAAGAANQRIQLALVAITGKDFKGALKQINDAPDAFVNPEDQVEALYCVAEAKSGLATDVESMKEAGIDYIRVIARAKANSVKSPRVIDSLYKTAVIHERIKANDEAVILYKQVAAEADAADATQKDLTAKSTAAIARLAAAVKKE